MSPRRTIPSMVRIRKAVAGAPDIQRALNALRARPAPPVRIPDPCIIRLYDRKVLTGGTPPKVIVFPDRVTAIEATRSDFARNAGVDPDTPIEIISIVRWEDRPR